MHLSKHQPKLWSETPVRDVVYYFAPAHFDALSPALRAALSLGLAGGINEQVLVNEFNGYGAGGGREIVIYTVVVGLIALILAGERSLVAFCRLPLLRPIGRVSYGAYVYHVPVLSLYDIILPSSELFVTRSGTLSRFGISYPVTLLIAFLSFRYIEAPVLRQRARFS
jgi:peptidoglycan/LPS O-acetylase OafA/YrhL